MNLRHDDEIGVIGLALVVPVPIFGIFGGDHEFGRQLPFGQNHAAQLAAQRLDAGLQRVAVLDDARKITGIADYCQRADIVDQTGQQGLMFIQPTHFAGQHIRYRRNASAVFPERQHALLEGLRFGAEQFAQCKRNDHDLGILHP